tara:strand:+ start:171 stop:1112 length:942 start_codon:yes stop_codon:yes gene_type:complete
MAKLKVDEIETVSTNQDVEVKTSGSTGALEIKGGTNDGTLQLNCSAQSHGVKLRSPANSAGQNYTMVLPDNQIAASKFLKVKSVTGDVGQLEYGEPPVADLTNLNASNITGGYFTSARFTLPGSTGAGFKLVSQSKVYSGNPTSITHTGLETDSVYRIVIYNMYFYESGGQYGSFSVPKLTPLNASGNAIGTWQEDRWVDDVYDLTLTHTSSYNYIELRANTWGGQSVSPFFGATIDMCTGDGTQAANSNYGGSPWIHAEVSYIGDDGSFGDIWAYRGRNVQDVIRGFKLEPTISGQYFMPHSRVLVYKYMEA